MNLPSRVDLRVFDVPIFDQGQEEACEANALIDVLEILESRNGTPCTLSRQFQFWNERAMSPAGTQQNIGGQPYTIMSAAEQFGACTEALWPYVPENMYEKPSDAAFAEALGKRVTGYTCINTPLPNDLPACIANPDYNPATLVSLKQTLANSLPVLIIMNIRMGLSAIHGALSSQDWSQYSSSLPYGQHAMVVVGYDDTGKYLILRNSWGTGYGDQGYFALPYNIFLLGETVSLLVVTGYAGYQLPTTWTPDMPTPVTPLPPPTITGCAIKANGEPCLTIVTTSGTKTYTAAQAQAGLTDYPQFLPSLIGYLNSMLETK